MLNIQLVFMYCMFRNFVIIMIIVIVFIINITIITHLKVRNHTKNENVTQLYYQNNLITVLCNIMKYVYNRVCFQP